MGRWYRYPGSQIPGSVLLDLALALLGDWALDYNLGWDPGKGNWSGLTVFEPPVRLSRGGCPCRHAYCNKRHVHAPPPPTQHNAQPKGPSPGDATCPQGTLVPENLHFFKQWKPVLSHGFKMVCLHCVFRESIFGLEGILINVSLIKNVCGQITWSI